VAFTCFGEGIAIYDPFNGEYRPTTKDDLKYCTRIIDSLEAISVVERCLGSQDKPPKVQAIHNYEAIVNNTTKPVFLGPENGANVKTILKMARAAVGEDRYQSAGSPVSFITCPVSPLRLVEDCCEIIMTCAEEEACLCILSMAMSGGSAPVNLAGTLVTHNAEVLTGIVLSQLTRKGSRVLYGSSTTAMNLKQASACVGSPELAMINAAVASLARYYNLPSWVAGG
jgi:trimethylamine--corrinoid protein Co-methyltransferase